jgi:hypothetical protein
MSRAGREKHPDQLAFKRGGRYRPLRVLESGETRKVPPISRSLRPETRRIWRELWRSPLAGAYQQTDIPALERWAWFLNEWLQAVSLPGDRRYVFKLEKALRDLEKAFGLDILSRLRLGLTLIDEHNAVNSLKASRAPEAREVKE